MTVRGGDDAFFLKQETVDINPFLNEQAHLSQLRPISFKAFAISAIIGGYLNVPIYVR